MRMTQAVERDKTRLADEEWARIFGKLRTIKGIGGFQYRHFVEAALWVLRVGLVALLAVQGAPRRGMPVRQVEIFP